MKYVVRVDSSVMPRQLETSVSIYTWTAPSMAPSPVRTIIMEKGIPTGNTHEAQVLLLDRDSQGKPWGTSVLNSQELLAVR
jgi:hypothetical protein